VLTLFGVQEFVLVLTALPLLFVSAAFGVFLADDDLLFLLHFDYRLGLLLVFGVFLLKGLFLLADYLGCGFLLEVPRFLLFLGWFGDLRYLEFPFGLVSVGGDF
jgi:hypothetical protein